MAESYSCNGEWIHFSNTACQELQLAWAKIAGAHDLDPAMKELSRALRKASEYAAGAAAIGIDDEYLDEPFSEKPVKEAWLRVMELLIQEICIGGPVAKGMDVNWSSDIKHSWIERLTKMQDCLSQQIET